MFGFGKAKMTNEVKVKGRTFVARGLGNLSVNTCSKDGAYVVGDLLELGNEEAIHVVCVRVEPPCQRHGWVEVADVMAAAEASRANPEPSAAPAVPERKVPVSGERLG